MCAEVSSSDGLKKAVRKHEKKLRQITYLEEQSSSRELTKEEIEKVSKKGNRPRTVIISKHTLPLLPCFCESGGI